MTYTQLDAKADCKARLRNVFFIGAALPGMIIQLGAGLKLNQARGASALGHLYSAAEADSVQRPPLLIRERGSPNASHFFWGTTNAFSLSVSVECTSCAENPIKVIDVGTAGHIHAVVLDFGANQVSQTISVELDQPSSEAEVIIPNYKSDLRNRLVWNQEKRQFAVIAGQTVAVQIQMRPGVWNGVRAIFDWPSFYVIKEVTVSKTKNG